MVADLPHRLGRPRAARATDTRDRILQAARDVFSEHGYESTTFQIVASRAELTRPAINHYFTSKPALYRAVLAQTTMVVAAALDRARQETCLIGRLSAYLLAIAQPPDENRTAAAFVVSAVLDAQRRPELRPLVDDLQAGTREFLQWVVTEAIDRGELVTEATVPELADMLSALLWGIGFYSAFVGDREQAATVTTDLQLLLAHRLWQIK